MKKIRKNTQLSLINQKRAGRPAFVDKGIRHIEREKFTKPTSLHLTIKVRHNKADIRNKSLLKSLHRAIMRGRLKGIKVIHYTLEYNHVHLLVEASDNKVLHKGMQAFGITISKAINKIKKTKGTVYKHRYHFRKISSAQQLKNVLHYIFNNGVHHKRSFCVLDPYNSLVCERRIEDIYKNRGFKIKADINKSPFLTFLKMELGGVLDEGRIFFNRLRFL